MRHNSKPFTYMAVILTAVLLMTVTASLKAGDRIANRADEIQPLLIGDNVPNTMVKNIEGQDVRLLDLIKRKPSVVIFYRGGWCPYCNVHLKQLQDIEQKLVDLGFQILAISADRPQKLRETLHTKDLNYTLLSDSKMFTTKAFGLCFKLDEKTFQAYEEHNLDIEGYSGETHHLLPVPSAFIIDTDGKIRFKYVNPDYKVRISSKVLLAAAESFLDNKE
ncbi:MAG: redoxin domain-containing protein [Caldithrix sp.]|nr:redoxin domain-containing protein [Caldithrix sp.]